MSLVRCGHSVMCTRCTCLRAARSYVVVTQLCVPDVRVSAPLARTLCSLSYVYQMYVSPRHSLVCCRHPATCTKCTNLSGWRQLSQPGSDTYLQRSCRTVIMCELNSADRHSNVGRTSDSSRSSRCTEN